MKIFSYICIVIFFTLGTQVSADVNVQLIVAGCNNDSVCEPVNGESYGSCPNDCTATSTPPSATTTTGNAQSGGQSTVTGGSTNALQFTDFVVTYTEDSMLLTWGTTKPTQSIVRWGLTDDYSVGTVSEIVYVKEHTTKISNILPDKLYYFIVDGKDALGNHIIYSGSFLLKKNTTTYQPQNVESFQSYSAPTGIGLRWENPEDVDYSYVRILRTTKKFPLSPNDGKIVYEGRGQTIVDIDVIDGVQYYYALFLKNEQNMYSSGVVLTATKYKQGVTPLESDAGFSYGQYPLDVVRSTSTNALRIEDIDFIQNGLKISFIGSNISVDANLPLIVSIPKRIWSVAFLTLTSSDQIYLVSLNTENNRLEAHIPALKTSGKVAYSLQIYKDGVFYQINNGVLDTFTSKVDQERLNDFNSSKKSKDWLILIPILVLLLILKKFFSKNKKTELK